MKIGGLLKFSLIDYPDKMAAVIFTQGCNFRCGYCHNPDLVLPEKFCAPLPEGEVLTFLEKRRGKLQGVVISGGEPTMQKDLLEFLQKVKQLGFLVKLDTNGSHPVILKQAIEEKLIDFVAMDIKAPLEKYSLFTQGHDYIDAIKESINIIFKADLPYQFRTTHVKSILSSDDIFKIKDIIHQTPHYRIQSFIKREFILDQKTSY